MFRASFKLRATEEEGTLSGLAVLNANIDAEVLDRIYSEFVISNDGAKIIKEPFFYGISMDLQYLLRRSSNWGTQLTKMEKPKRTNVKDLDLGMKQQNMLRYSLSLLPGVLEKARFTTHDLPRDSSFRKKALSDLKLYIPEDFVYKIDRVGRYLSAQRDIR